MLGHRGTQFLTLRNLCTVIHSGNSISHGVVRQADSGECALLPGEPYGREAAHGGESQLSSSFHSSGGPESPILALLVGVLYCHAWCHAVTWVSMGGFGVWRGAGYLPDVPLFTLGLWHCLPV